jgi:hypothetical protein
MTIASPNHWWQNWSKTHGYVAQKMFFPKSPGEIADAIQSAEASHYPLRAVGGGWSFSDASLPGAVTTNRPSIYAVEALAEVVPQATLFPPDKATVSIASIAGNTSVKDDAGAMVMLNGFVQPPAIDPDWTYLGGGGWKFKDGTTFGTNADEVQRPGFLNKLAGLSRRPVRKLANNICLEESDTAGSLVMFDLAMDATMPSRDWFYDGHGVWSVGLSENPQSRPFFEGNLQDLSKDHRLTSFSPFGGMNLSPRAAQAGESLSFLLAKQQTVMATPEPVYLINTRSLVSSLQQKLPSLLSNSARDATSAQPTNGKLQRFLFHVEAGITISELGRLLSHQSPRLSLQAISGSPGATLAGALSSSTHGAEFNWPLVVDTVKAVHLVGPGGLQWWIEGSESIADPQAIQAAYPDIPLERIISGANAPGGIVSQDWLNAAIVSMGSMGVLYSVVLEVVPLFGVHEIVVQTSWRNLPSPGTVGQQDWRWCHKCEGLFYSGGQTSLGVCPVGGRHEKGVSSNYTLAHDAPGAVGQQDWRWCPRCQGLFYSGGQASAGRCPSGGKHEKAASGNYILANDSPGTLGQSDWRWCSKCQGLFYSEGQASVGSCPAGGKHEKGVSGNYTLAHDAAPLLRSPSTSRQVSAGITELLQRGELNGTGISRADAQGKYVNQYADLAINPNRKADGDYDCWIGNREVTSQVPLDPQPLAGNETGDMIKGIGMALGPVNDRDAKLVGIYGFRSLVDIIMNRPVGPDRISEIEQNITDFMLKVGRVTRASDIVNVGLDAFLTPLVGKPDGPEVAQAILTGVLSGLLGTANCDRRSDKTGVSVGALGFPESGVMGTAMEIALSPADAFTFLQTEILDYADLNMNKNIPFFGYVSIRLCSNTNTLMGMQQFGDTANPCSVMIEIVGFATPESREFMHDLQKRTLDRIEAGTLDAMLHWGLENEQLRSVHLRKTKALQKHSQSGMSKLTTFKTVRALVHAAAPAAFRVFDNGFSERLGLSTLDGLVFCDDKKKLIHNWYPTALLAQPGSPLTLPHRLESLALLNQLNRAVQVTSVRITSSKDTTAPVFKLLSPRQFGVNANQIYWMEVEYTGTTAGPVTGIVEVECDDPIDPFVRIPLSATVVAIKQPELRFTPASLDLGTRLVGATVWQDLTIENIGTGDATFASIELSPAGPFTVQPNYPALALPGGVAAGNSVVIRVLYQPIVRGAAQATVAIDVRSQDPQYSHRYEIPVAATAQMPTIFLASGPQRSVHMPGEPDRPVRDLELKVLDFGVAPINKTSVASFWIRNVGDAPLTVQSVVADRNNFETKGNFPSTLAPGSELEVQCTFFAPTDPGMTVAGQFRLLSDDPIRVDGGSPPQPGAILKVKGRSGGPKLTEPVEFEQGVVVIQQSATFTFRSDGTDPTVVKGFKIVELNPGTNFSVSSVPQIPARLDPGSELKLMVTLRANQPGMYEADLLVTHNGNPHQSSQVRVRATVT